MGRYNFWGKAVLLTFVVVLGVSCSSQTTLYNNSMNQTLTKQGTHHFFVWGIGQIKQENVEQVCGDISKVAKTRTIATLPNLLGSIVTLGLWLPRTYEVYCSNTVEEVAEPEVIEEQDVSTETEASYD